MGWQFDNSDNVQHAVNNYNDVVKTFIPYFAPYSSRQREVEAAVQHLSLIHI